MRAHFASDVPASPDTEDIALSKKQPDADVHMSENDAAGAQELLKSRIQEFKSDSSKMAVVGEFIDEVLEKAEEEAIRQQENGSTSSQQKNKSPKQNFAMPDFKNGRVVNKARGFVVRLFESICNCANNAAAAPVTRFKFRSGKRASTSAPEAPAAANGRADSSKRGEEKVRKPGNGKEKKSGGIKFKDEAEPAEQEAIELQ